MSTSDNAHVWEHMAQKVTEAEYEELVLTRGFKMHERAPAFWPDGVPFKSESLKLQAGNQKVWQAIFKDVAEMKLNYDLEVRSGRGPCLWVCMCVPVSMCALIRDRQTETEGGETDARV